jgi:NADPH2:quinone reductase
MQGNRSLTGVFFGAALALERDRAYPMVQRQLDDIARGGLQVIIDRTYPLAEAAAAHAYIESRAAFGRVVLVV